MLRHIFITFHTGFEPLYTHGNPTKSLHTEKKLVFNPVRTGEGGVFQQAQGFLPITLEVIKLHSRNLVTFPKI